MKRNKWKKILSMKTEKKRRIWEPDSLSGVRNVLVSICVFGVWCAFERNRVDGHTQDGNVEMRKIYDDTLNMS